MVVTVEVSSDRTTWTDVSGRVTRLTHKLTGRELEAVDFDVVQPTTTLAVGMYVRVKRGASTVFEGIIYEVRRRRGEGRNEYTIRAYSELVLYDRRVVFRNYQTGTSAGDIIKDLAALETGVDVTNVDEGPSLNSPWEIQNAKALEIMKSTARGTNYYIRMRPGRVLYFKPKQVGTPKITFDDTNVLESEYSEDRWKLKNRVIYVGANGEVLADVSEPPGDLPVVVHDPFLTDVNEAHRRAQIRLALNKEFGRELRLTVGAPVVENAGLDLFDTVRVNIPGLGLSNVDMFIVEMEYEPLEKVYRLTVGGRLELFEEFFDEAIGSDVAARFGQAVSVPEILSTLSNVTTNISKLTIDVKTPIYLNKPPLKLVNAVNIVLDGNGYAVLTSSATSGSFEIRLLPPSGGETFSNYILAEWFAEKNGGSVQAELLDADGNLLFSVYDAYETQFFSFPRWPWAKGFLTYRTAGGWGSSGASASNVRLGQINEWCIRLTPNTLGTNGEIYYPSAQNLGLNLNRFRYMRLYLYGDHAADFTVKIRLYQDASNYKEGTITVLHDVWAKYELAINSFTTTGTPSTINYIGITSPYRLLIDSDFVLLSHVFETVRLKFTLSRRDTASASPQIQAVKIVWREGG
jgi:hypothetical protein